MTSGQRCPHRDTRVVTTGTRAPPEIGRGPRIRVFGLLTCTSRLPWDLRARRSRYPRLSRRTVVFQLGHGSDDGRGRCFPTRPSPRSADTGGRSDGTTWSVYYRPSASPPLRLATSSLRCSIHVKTTYFFLLEWLRNQAAMRSRLSAPRDTLVMNSIASDGGVRTSRYPAPSRKRRVVSSAVRLFPS